MATISVTHFGDPGCPWGYSARPAHAVLRWRYGAGLRWRLALIGLTESGDQYERRGYTPAGSAKGYNAFRRYGMPFATDPRPRVPGTGRACRAVVAARAIDPELGDAAFGALQFAYFTTPAVMDADEAIGGALATVDGLDAAAILAALDDPATEDAYQADRAEARTAEGSPPHAQGKTARSDGPERYTAPSLIFATEDGRRLEAGGFQPVEAYDVCVANLDPRLGRRPAPDSPAELLATEPRGLTTQEVAAVLARGNDRPDRAAAEDALIDLVAAGRATRTPLGDDALWRPVS